MQSMQKQQKLPTIQFNKAPKFLFNNPHYNHISNNAKLLYTLLLDRHNLSMKNQDKFSDIKGTFIIFTREEMAFTLNCCKRTIQSLMAELRLVGLIHEKRMGLNKPNRIYVISNPQKMQIASSEIPKDKSKLTDISEEANLTVQESTNTASQKEQNLPINNTNINNTNITNTDSNTHDNHDIINLSIFKKEEKRKKRLIDNNHNIKSKDSAHILKEKIYKQIKYYSFIPNNNLSPENISLWKKKMTIINEIVNTMIYVQQVPSIKYFLINDMQISANEVQTAFNQITKNNIEYVYCSIKNIIHIKNMRAYLITTLYNSLIGADLFVEQKFNKPDYYISNKNLSEIEIIRFNKKYREYNYIAKYLSKLTNDNQYFDNFETKQDEEYLAIINAIKLIYVNSEYFQEFSNTKYCAADIELTFFDMTAADLFDLIHRFKNNKEKSHTNLFQIIFEYINTVKEINQIF